MGHRNSIDIDLFTQNTFDTDFIINTIEEAGYNFEVNYNFKNTIIGFINKVKVDFIAHTYPFVNAPITEEGISFLSMQDIAAMKLNAISIQEKD